MNLVQNDVVNLNILESTRLKYMFNLHQLLADNLPWEREEELEVA